MVANALMLTIAIVLGLGFWFMQRLTYFISYKSVLFRFYGTPILIYCAVRQGAQLPLLVRVRVPAEHHPARHCQVPVPTWSRSDPFGGHRKSARVRRLWDRRIQGRNRETR